VGRACPDQFRLPSGLLSREPAGDRPFFDEHSKDGEAAPGGLLAEKRGQRIFALGAYVGEVVLRKCGGTWRADDSDPEGEINIEVVLPSGTVLWPVQRVMKRFRNGPEDGIYAYAWMLRQ
jgi:hypothetical protein